MKRKRGARKKPVAKKPPPKKSVSTKAAPENPTPVSADEEAFLDFVGQNVGEKSVSNENNNEFVQLNTAMQFSTYSSSSSSSSSEDGEAFGIRDSSSESDEPAIDMRVKKSAKKPVLSKGKASSKATNAPVMSSKGLGSTVMSSKGVGSTVMSSKGMSSMSRKEFPVPKEPYQDPRYNKKELKVSLAVIKKVMEMDEATPFNAPVDPVAQGIPDYFSVISTPMDFGTICGHLENGVKYMNSDDVYKGVQYIWDNCSKYNKKGDYIMYLMKRVKKKFMKCWTAAGLRTEMSRKHSGHSYLVPPSVHAMKQSKREAMSVVDPMVSNPNVMPWNKFGTSQLHPQVHQPSYSRPYQYHEPQPSTNQMPQFSQLQVNSSYAGHSHIPGPQYPIPPTMNRPVHPRQQQLQSNSHYMGQFPQNTSWPWPSQLHFSTDINNAGPPQFAPSLDCAMKRNGCATISSMDPVYASVDQPQPQVQLPNHSQQNESHQPQASMGQPQPSHPLASDDISSPEVSDGGKERGDSESYSSDSGDEAQLVEQCLTPQLLFRGDGHPDGSQIRIQDEKRRVRGPTRCRFISDVPDGQRIVVPINSLGQPVGPEARKLASFLGTVARDGYKAPLHFLDWSAMPENVKEDLWQFVQTKFDIDPLCKTWVLRSLASKWRNWKAKLKADHYTPHATDEERLMDLNRRVLPDQWAALIAHWNSEEVQLRSVKNKANRAKQKSSHAAGSKSFARIREEEKAKRPDGKEPTRGELYIMTRTRKDGQPIDGKAAEVITKLHEKAKEQKENSDRSNDLADSYCQVMGREKHGHVRMYGLGVSPTDLCGRKPTRSSIMRMAAEAKKSANEEVGKMLTKMETMEQRYASLEAQISNMASNMQKLIDKMSGGSLKQVPNNAPEDSLQAQEHSSSSSRAVENEHKEA